MQKLFLQPVIAALSFLYVQNTFTSEQFQFYAIIGNKLIFHLQLFNMYKQNLEIHGQVYLQAILMYFFKQTYSTTSVFLPKRKEKLPAIQYYSSHIQCRVRICVFLTVVFEKGVK